jgi:bacillithiol biosynthesis deacetylase BshB1
MKVDILAIGIHPDDVELSCSGTLIKEIKSGKKVAILDLSEGELGTRGDADTRKKEAAAAAEIMGVANRVILNMRDGFFTYDEAHIRQIVTYIRLFQPEIILCNAPHDRHPDHGKAGKLLADAAFYSGLVKIKTHYNSEEQQVWRPKAVYHYIQDRFIKPDVVVDVSAEVDAKMDAIMAYSSQFYNPESAEPATPISGKDFMDFVKAKMRVTGREAGVEYGEGYVVTRIPAIDSLLDLK